MINERIQNLKVEIFADGAEKGKLLELAKLNHIKGLTTNPTLMAKAGIKDYKEFALGVLQVVTHKSISFEVFSDDFKTMEQQAREISSWGNNVFVKVPITNTKGESSLPLVSKLSASGVKVNVTAIMTLEQIMGSIDSVDSNLESYISVFAGRIADTGRDPIPMMRKALELMAGKTKCKLIWASPRELLNIFQADDIGCHIITVTHDTLGKLNLINKDLKDYSLDTVKMFYNDGLKAGFTL